MKHLGMLCVFFALANVCYGEESGCGGNASGGGQTCPAVGQRLGHLLEATEHLTAAGETEQAQRVQQLVAQECRQLVARLKAVEAELARLRPHQNQPQQVLIELKLVELSRTKMRALGFDFADLDGGDFQVAGQDEDTFRLQVVDGTPRILDILESLQKHGVAKTLAEPTLVTVSGRPAAFHVGGEVPAIVPHGDGSQTLEHREIGVRVDAVAIVQADGKIRLELRPRISELDAANSLPGKPVIKERWMDTGVELDSGQTIVMSGMVQSRVEASNIGIPWLADIPYLGKLFSSVEERVEEVELMMLAKAELVESTDLYQASQASAVGPGLPTASPEDHDLYVRGYRETPSCSTTPCPQPTPRALPSPSPAKVLPAPKTSE